MVCSVLAWDHCPLSQGPSAHVHIQQSNKYLPMPSLLHTLNFSVNSHHRGAGQNREINKPVPEFPKVWRSALFVCHRNLRQGRRQTANYSPNLGQTTGRANGRLNLHPRWHGSLQHASVNICFDSNDLVNVWLRHRPHNGAFLHCTAPKQESCLIQPSQDYGVILLFDKNDLLFTVPWPQREALLPLWQQSGFQRPTVESQRPRQASFSGTDCIGNSLSKTDHQPSPCSFTASVALRILCTSYIKWLMLMRR